MNELDKVDILDRVDMLDELFQFKQLKSKKNTRTGIQGFSDVATAFQEGFVEGIKPRELLGIATWCNKNIKLAGSASSEPGYFRWERTPYVKGIYDALENDNDVREVVWIAGAQVAKTQTGNNWLLNTIPNTPGPFLYVAPSVDLAKLASKQRIAPLIEDCEELRSLLPQGKRDSGNTVLLKEYDGGILRFTGANSAAGLRSMPARYLYCDEIDAFPANVDGEGDPIDLARKRLTTYKPVSKTFLTSTPTVKGRSAIEREFLQTDRRFYFVPCPHCGHAHILEWKNMKWEGRDSSTARMVCPSCKEDIPERFKTEMLEKGQWIATSDAGRKNAVGFHLSSLYSPLGWLSWADMVEEWLASQDNPEKLQTFINTRLAETWEEKNDSVVAEVLEARAETLGPKLPAGVRMLTTSSDVQDDRIETLVVGWGKCEEMYVLEHRIFYGNLEQAQVWQELGAFLESRWEVDADALNIMTAEDVKLETGEQVETSKRAQESKRYSMGIACSTIDTGGHFTDAVLKFCASNKHLKVIPIKGANTSGRDVISKSNSRNAYGVELKLVGTDTAKDKLFARFLIERPGPGFVHFSDTLDHEFFEQLTAEKLVSKYVKGRGMVKQYVKIRRRNEALDLMVYALASLYSKGAQFLKRLNNKAMPTPLFNARQEGQDWVAYGQEVAEGEELQVIQGTKAVERDDVLDSDTLQQSSDIRQEVVIQEQSPHRRKRMGRVQHNPNFSNF